MATTAMPPHSSHSYSLTHRPPRGVREDVASFLKRPPDHGTMGRQRPDGGGGAMSQQEAGGDSSRCGDSRVLLMDLVLVMKIIYCGLRRIVFQLNQRPWTRWASLMFERPVTPVLSRRPLPSCPSRCPGTADPVRCPGFPSCTLRFATAGALALLLCPAAAQGLHVGGLTVPRYLVVGQRATLACHVGLEGDSLYSVTWWKDGRQFYQYTPSKPRPVVAFTVPGISVNAGRSALTTVELEDVTLASSGHYRCEAVADGPSFATDHRTANMTVIDPGALTPQIVGVAPLYRVGETIRLYCSAPRAPHPHTLSWTSAGRVILDEHVTLFPSGEGKQPPKNGSLSLMGGRASSPVADTHLTRGADATPVLMLELTASLPLFPTGSLTLSCRCAVHEYQRHTSVTLHLDPLNYTPPHLLPTLQHTGSSSADVH
ncbi:uncharacterized protein LOC125179025, partial [Hyalella azteca]|uniref:Uncharacterized protein LOC125179025 n=1 Tax=Hyalella azteca TaxID=294128 RepID=A0A979FS90_HYAAZ